jgi:hypothetical protein
MENRVAQIISYTVTVKYVLRFWATMSIIKMFFVLQKFVNVLFALDPSISLYKCQFTFLFLYLYESYCKLYVRKNVKLHWSNFIKKC